MCPRPSRATPARRAGAGARGPAAPAFIAAAAVPLAVYLLTLQRSLPAGDSGELVTAAWTWGVAHPPGYPLYVALAGAFAHALPALAPALALNLFSALAMAAAAGLLALATARLSGSRVAGVLAAWAFAFAVPAWKLALVAEVFALHALLAALLLWLLARACAAPPPAAAPPAGAAAGVAGLTALSLAHHQTLLLLGVPASLVAIACAWRGAAGARARLAGLVAAAAVLALLPLAWLPFAAGRRGALAWGEADRPRGFVSLLLRDDYGTFRLDPLGAGMHADRSHLALWIESLPRAFGWLPLALALAGAAVLARRRRPVAAALAGYAVLQALFFTRVGFPSGAAWLRGVVERFHVLPALVLALLAGAGLAWLLERLPRAARPAAAVLALAATLALPLRAHWAAVDQHDNRLVEALGDGLLASLPPRAVLFVAGDVPHNALAYLTRVRGRRPDVTVVDEELMTYPWYVRRLRAEHPDVLPPLGGAQRIRLRDGRRLEGWTVPRADGTVDVLTERGQQTRPAADLVAAAAAPAESLFADARAGFRRGRLGSRSEDRYSGLPGTRSLLWLDHLAPARPAAFLGVKDGSWSLRYRLTPMGFVEWASPRGTPPGVEAQARGALHVFAATPMEAGLRAYDPTSFEAVERLRFTAVAARAALVLSQPRAAGAIRANPAGWARTCAFAARFEALDPTPDPACLRAIGFLRVFGPGFEDHARARLDLERALAAGGPAAARDAEARTMLAQLGREGATAGGAR